MPMASHLRTLFFSRALSPTARSRTPTLTSSCCRIPVSPLRSATPRVPRTPITQRNTMATDSQPKKMEWLVVVPDFPGAHEKRLEVRPTHFANLGPVRESGLIQMGGAVLNEIPTSDDPSTFSFAGSTLVVVASSREEIKEVLRKDVYAQSGVWDVENAQMWPFLCAFRNQK
ncbi:hypothetical protein VTI74DRAFT_985 [Chaetomium olivicolor]